MAHKTAGQTKKDAYDILVTGGGPAGLCFARRVSGAGLRVAVIEKQPEKKIAAPAYDGREIAMTHLSQRILADCGIWQMIDDDGISVIRDAKVQNGASPYALHFDHETAGTDYLGVLVSNNLIRKAAYRAVRECGDVDILCGVSVVVAETGNAGVSVTLDNGRVLTGAVLVAADSRFSPLRKMMGIETEIHDFKRTCIVTRLSHTKPHDQTAYECFFDDITIAVLPLNNGRVSIVLTLDADHGADMMALPDRDFARMIEDRIGRRLGRMAQDSARNAYPLVAVYAEKFYAERFALLGDAAVGMHPVTAHGFNFGLRGADTLAECIHEAVATGTDIGSRTMLERYHRQHRRATKPVYHGTNALVSLYTRNGPVTSLARHALLRLGNRLTPARQLIVNMLTESRK